MASDAVSCTALTFVVLLFGVVAVSFVASAVVLCFFVFSSSVLLGFVFLGSVLLGRAMFFGFCFTSHGGSSFRCGGSF